jgi:peroxiredoxin
MSRKNIFFTTIITLLSFAFANAQLFQSVKVAKVGEQAPDFSLTDFQGKAFNFSKAKNDKVRMFWFTNLCSGCLSVISDMEKIKSMYEKKGVEIVAVSQLGEDKATVERIVKDRKLSIRFLYDPKGDATAKYSGRYTPGTCPLKSLYIVQKNGTIQFANHFPGVPSNEIANQLEKALAAK